MDQVVSFQNKMKTLFEQHGQLLRFEKGHSLFLEGERANDCFYIKSGLVHLTQQTESGKEMTLRICGDDVLIGESAPFCHVHYYATSAIIANYSEIYRLSNKQFELLLTEHPAYLVDFLSWLQTENIKNQTRIRDLVILGKKGALFSTLIRLSNTYGEILEDESIFINFPLTNSEIASLCSTSREMINRMLNDLKQHQIISFQKGYITIHQLAFLKKEIECANCPLTICRID